MDKAFSELVEIGLVDAPAGGWKVFGAQSAGCNPIATALHDGTDVITPVKPTGIAKSLNIGDPAAGAVRAGGGAAHRRLDGRTPTTTRSAPASGCWPAPPACSPRPPAA